MEKIKEMIDEKNDAQKDKNIQQIQSYDKIEKKDEINVINGQKQNEKKRIRGNKKTNDINTNEIKLKKQDKENHAKQDKEKNKNELKIFGFSIWRLIAYFIIYSILGFFVETIFGAITKGVIESRKSFLYGPFCAIYGLGAVVMLICLKPFGKSNGRLFWGGFVVGSIIEYIVSLIGEWIFHVKWWDYSNMPLNIQGRVCVYFSIFWGLLGILLVSSINPRVDKFIDFIVTKIGKKKIIIIEIIIAFFLLFDWIITSVALQFFYIRMVKNYNINIGNTESIKRQYDEIYGNEKLAKFIYTFWSDEKMLKTLPNLKVQDNDGKIVYFYKLLPNIQNYYYKFYDGGIRDKIKQDINEIEEEQQNKLSI